MTRPLPEPGELDADEHAQIGRRFPEHAKSQLDEGDRLQAAEKVWGSAAHDSKRLGSSVAGSTMGTQACSTKGEHPGREIDKEAQFSGHLAQAEYMHRNFYHNDRSGTAIRSALNDVEKLVGELEVIRNLPPRPFVVQDNDDRVRLG